MNTKSNLIIIILLLFLIPYRNAQAEEQPGMSGEEHKVFLKIQRAKDCIEKNGKEKAIFDLKKNTDDVFIGDYKGVFLVSPLHPELIGKNCFYFKDNSGKLVVQEEINKAMEGGGWLKGRWRKNPKTERYQCRKIYITPMPGDYFIGSWYHYDSDDFGICLL
jgi:hypothetical protein